jgi:F-type H+-transporting ATPase subunit b
MEHQHESFFADPRTWVGVAFVIFFVIFGRKLWGILTSILDKRAVEIRAELDEAARLRREAEALLADARTQRETALRDAQTMLVQAHEEAARVAVAARADAAAAGTRRERLAMDRISAAEKAAVSDVRLAAADIAARASEVVIRREFTADADSALIDHAIQGLPSALAGRRAA